MATLLIMDIDLAKLDSWRAYLLEYATGLLWILGLLAFAVSGENIRSAVKWWSDTAQIAQAVHIPESFASFALIVLLLVVPYTVAVALKPISSSIMDTTLRIQAMARVGLYARRPEDLRERAAHCIRVALGVGGWLSHEMHLVYLSVKNRELGRRMQLRIDDARFRSAAAIPISLFVGGLAYHAPWRLLPWATAVLAILFSFTLLALRAGRDLVRSYEQIDAAVIFAATSDASLLAASDAS